MSTHSAPSVMAMPSVAGSNSLSVVLAPENTPTSHSPTPQLAIWTEPIMDHDNDSMVNYSQSEVEEDDNTAPTGCLTNNPTSRHFYPIYLTNPLFGHGREQPCVVLAKYIKYSTDYRYTYSMLKKGVAVMPLRYKQDRTKKKMNRQVKLQLYEQRQVTLYLPVTAEGYLGLCPLCKDQRRIHAVGRM